MGTNSMECGISTNIESSLEKVKAEPFEGYLDNQSSEGHSLTSEQLAVSGRLVDIGSQSGSIITKYMLTSGPSDKYTGVLDKTWQGDEASNGLDTSLQETQGCNALGVTLKGNQESSGMNNHFSTAVIKSRTVGHKRVCCNLDSEAGSVCTPVSTVSVKNEYIEENCNGSLCCNESVSSRICSFTEPQDAFGPSEVCASTSNLPILEKEFFVSRTSSTTLSGKPGALSGSFVDAILDTAENLNSLKSTLIRNVKSEPFDQSIEISEENSSESTFTRKPTTEPFESAIGASEKNSPEAPCFIKKDKELFEPAIEASENGENSVSHFMFRADIKEEISVHQLDVIDHLPLKERFNMLMVRQAYSSHQDTAATLNTSKLPTSIIEAKADPFEPTIETSENRKENFSESSSFIKKVKTEPFEPAMETSENGKGNVSHLDMITSATMVEECNGHLSDVTDHISLKDRLDMLLDRQTCSLHKYTAENLEASKLPTSIMEVKTEPPEPTVETSEDRKYSISLTEVKTELFEPIIATSEDEKYNISDLEVLRAHVKPEKISEFLLDEIDHISLQDRLKMLLIRQAPSFKHPRIQKVSKTNDPSNISRATTGTTNSTRRCKRKRTATDSVEEALGEDAPELLQVLVDQGINMEEIKLYEVMDGDDDLIDVTEDDFSDLGNVMSKLFFQRSNSLLKLNSLRDMKDSKASYSFSCLISLIHQAQYLQLRKCPVEWGWCRDLQSFIFIFEKHNRIVLERPEYGYATYFFELVNSLPINWQIKRLIIAMKLTNCSRIAIIENKSLMVGQDLTEGEARVLEDYGWKPASGLASMLNFRDRVVHDRRTEMSISEWKSKIGKLLMDGFDGGRIVLQALPRKYLEKQKSQSKVEIGADEKTTFDF